MTPRMRTVLLTGLRVIVLILAGIACYCAFPPHGLWFLGIAGFALCYAVLKTLTCSKHPLWASTGAGILWGLSYFLPLFIWIHSFVGILPWLALCLLMTLFSGLQWWGSGLLLLKWPHHPLGSVPSLALWWTACEVLRAHFPFGGFSWGTPAFGQVTGPFLGLAPVGSTTGTNLVVLAVSFLLAEIVTTLISFAKNSDRTRSRQLSGVLLCSVVLSGVMSGAVLYHHSLDATPRTGALRVAYIQGGVVASGLDFNSVRIQVLRNHVTETKHLAEVVRRHEVPQPDVVVWPENSADIDPLGNPIAGDLLTEASRAIKAPILVGAVLGRDSHHPDQNAVLLWTPDGYASQSHIKRHIQPFGEYLPWRPLIEKLSPYAQYAGHFVAGDGDGTMQVAGTTVGVATCYEVAFADSTRLPVNEGASWLIIPSNNATFGYSNQTFQQLGISRFRAAETHREAIVAATSGTSAFISAEGVVSHPTELYTSAFAVDTIPLYSVRTVAMSVEPVLSIVVAVLAIILCCFSLFSQIRRKLRS